MFLEDGGVVKRVRTWTVDEIIAADATHRELLRIVAGRKRISLLEIVLDERISDSDALWCTELPGALTSQQYDRWARLKC